MTQVTYNDITIKDVLTHSVDQQVVYDADGQVDQWYVKTVVTIQFTFHTVDGAGLGYSNGTDLIGGVAPALRALTTNRKRFTMDVGGSVLFDVGPGSVAGGAAHSPLPTFDVNNGPRPSLQINEIIGTKIARGTFTIELAVPSCTGYSQNGITSLRWWTTDDVDGNWYTTRTVHGRLRTSRKEVYPHAFRDLVFPPLQYGFKREGMSFTESPNGLELGFSIKDVEKFRSAPYPATSWRGTHRMVSQVPGAAVTESECTVTLEGAHDTPQTQLAALAVRIIDAKLLLSEQGLGKASVTEGKPYLLFYALEAALHENTVTATCRIRHLGQSIGDAFIFTRQAQTFGENLPANVSLVQAYNPLVSRLLPGPTAPLPVLMSLLQTPCNPAEMDRPTPIDPGGTVTPEDKAATYPVTTGDPPTEYETADYSDEHLKFNYTSYAMLVEDFQSGGKALVEYANDSLSSDDDTAAVINLTQGRSSRNITVTAKRNGAPPALFKPINFTDDNGFYHDIFYDLAVYRIGVVQADGTQEHIATQKLRYHLTKSKTAGLDVIVPLMPWLKAGAQQTVLPSGMFSVDPA